jgi:hypothetical protein
MIVVILIVLAIAISMASVWIEDYIYGRSDE